jgi:hypothetical protein
VVGNPENGRALEYEDAPENYIHPRAIDSGWLDEPEWKMDFGKDIFGGHVTHVTVSVSQNGKTVFSRTMQRDFFIVGGRLPAELKDAYIDSRTAYSRKVRSIAKSISFQESRGNHFWTKGVHGRARHELYPLIEREGSGFGLMQLTSERFLGREAIWNWKKNIDVSMGYIRECYEKSIGYLNTHPEGVTERMVLLETCNRYNGGLSDRYHWWSDGRHTSVSRGWKKFSYIPIGDGTSGYRDYNNDGIRDPHGNPWNIPPRLEDGAGISGPNTVAHRAARYADQVLALGQIFLR